jgi:hypothetical protein
MTARSYFLAIMAERRCFARGTADHAWRTRAARTYLALMRKVPADDWR